MSLEKHYCVRFGSSIDMGSYTWDASVGDLTGSTARIRIGPEGAAALVELTSDGPPVESVVSWDTALRKLAIDLHQTDIAPLVPGGYRWESTIILSDGTELEGPSGRFHVNAAIGAKVT